MHYLRLLQITVEVELNVVRNAPLLILAGFVQGEDRATNRLQGLLPFSGRPLAGITTWLLGTSLLRSMLA
jgi:hypothetical protein